jgi:hypothetical protein
MTEQVEQHPVGDFVGVTTFDFEFGLGEDVVLVKNGKAGKVVTLQVMETGIAYNVYADGDLLCVHEGSLARPASVTG